MFIGIRKEDKNDFERRVPLTPSHVKTLIQNTQAHVSVEPSQIRIFSDEDYKNAGAEVSDQWSQADLILAVKEIPDRYFRPKASYLFFSHTIKGQKDNMPSLKKLMEHQCTLFDYERLVDDHNRRLVFFGPFAGQAGMIDCLWTYGRWCEKQGITSPLQHIKQALSYSSLDEALSSVKQVGEEISKSGLPLEITPLVVGFGGYGSVAKGAWQVFDLLPHIEVSPSDLANLYTQNKFSNRHVYKVVYKESDLVVHKYDNSPFSLAHYFAHPDQYNSQFTSHLPHLSIYMNCIFWTAKSPRFITKEAVKTLYKQPNPKLRVIGDISCDIEGSVELTLKATTPAEPVFVYDTLQDTIIDGIDGHGPIVLAVDNLPCELPTESSTFFADHLYPLIEEFAKLPSPQDTHLLSSPWQKAMVLKNGKLTNDYQYLESFLNIK